MNGAQLHYARGGSDDVDALANAFHKTEIDPGSGQDTNESEAAAALLLMTGHGFAEDAKPAAAQAVNTAKPTPVDIYIAPAVLGHRWVRSRSVAHVVERPERLRACLLGLSALVGQLYQARSAARLAQELKSLSVDDKSNLHAAVAADEHGETLLRALISDVRLPLSGDSQGLLAIHAHEDERLSSNEIGDAPPYAVKTGASISWPNQIAAPYIDVLRSMCRAAPTHQPAPLPPPRSIGKGRGLQDDGIPPQLPPALLSDGSYASEVPAAWPQGDLYLCGPQQTDFFGIQEEQNVHVKIENAYDSFEFPQTPPLNKGQTISSANEGKNLRDGSLGAIEASLGTCCAALDRVVAAAQSRAIPADPLIQSAHLSHLEQTDQSGMAKRPGASAGAAKRAFVLARPPGHHCTSNRPSGFCWVNNVAVMAAHAYAQHGIDRIAVLDFDLHHGDGTQAIVWRINAETAIRDAARKAQIEALLAERHGKSRHVKGATSVPLHSPDSLADIEARVGRRGLRLFYGSLHDIESFPCETGDKEKVYDASVCLEGAHGQWIWNVHLGDHRDGAGAYEKAYEHKYRQLLTKAQHFFEQTASSPEKSLLVISAGFDACVLEHPGMQRHGKSVPTDFYTRFTREAIGLADRFTDGKCISVLEGGYSDKALITGVAAHLVGLAGLSDEQSAGVCQTTSLAQLDRISKLSAASMVAHDTAPGADLSALYFQRRRQELGARDPDWLKHALEAFKRLQECCGSTRAPIPTVTAPSTPFGDDLWRTPRKTRSTRNLAQSAKASPMK